MSSLDVTRLFGVEGYVAVVTGGTSGIGLMICKVGANTGFFCGIFALTNLQGLVTNGAKVYVVGLQTDSMDEITAELNKLGEGYGGTAHRYLLRLRRSAWSILTKISIACDVSSKEEVDGLARQLTKREAHIDILVSNAGIRRDPPIQCDVLKAPLEELQASMWSSNHSDWVDTFNVNSTAHYFLSVALLPLLAAASQDPAGPPGRGVVIVTSSCASMHNATNIDLTSYATSKAATDHLVRLLAAKFSRFYVRVVGINPGCKCLERCLHPDRH